MHHHESYAYRVIKTHYGDKRTKRTGVLLMNHINEGLVILEAINATYEAKQAYCLHPLVQEDEDLKRYFPLLHGFDALVVARVMEYRNIANSYLSTHKIFKISEIRLSPLWEVQDMLIADKIQNRKDFELYHYGLHPRTAELVKYFDNWFERLGITKDMYRGMVQQINGNTVELTDTGVFRFRT